MVFLCVVAVLLAVKAGTPTMNTITFPPGSTSQRSYSCLQGLERTSKATVWFCIPVRALQPLEPPPLPPRKAQPLSFPQPSLMIFQRHTKGLVAQWCTIVGESSDTHEAFSAPFGMSRHPLPLHIFLPLHDAHVPPVGKGRVVWIRRQRATAWDNGTCVHQWQCGWLLRTKYYLQLTLKRNYSSNPLQKQKNQLTWQHLERGQEEGQAL